MAHEEPAAEPGVALACYRHPDRQAYVRCQRCERPICPSCVIPAPVGVQCPECVRAGRPRSVGAPPAVTTVLVLVNVGVFAAGLVLAVALTGTLPLMAGSPFAVIGGLFGPAIAGGQWWRVLTSGFLHAGLLHLAFNMAALYVAGASLEAAVGRARLLAIYICSLVAGSLGALVVSPHALTVGASGAIFGLFGALLVGQRAAGINPWRSGLGALIAVNLVFTFAAPGISIGGHIGGLLGGLAAAAVMLSRRARTSGRTGFAGSLAVVAALTVLLFAACLLAAGA